MRRLIYVPIIHTEADMGSLAFALERDTAAFCGKQRWERHKVITAKFWQMVSEHLETLDTKKLKIYQDSLAADGGLGREIIKEGVRRGSKNYEILLKLVDRDAQIVSTEDKTLLQEEYQYLSQMTQVKTPSQQRLAYKEYKLHKDRLTRQRDNYIAQKINETLRDGEVGLLFLGAYHDILPRLNKDIIIQPLKEPEKVRAYFDELLSGDNEKNLVPLMEYLVSPASQSKEKVS